MISGHCLKKKLDQETWLCLTHLDDLVIIWIYKNQVEPGYKGQPIEFIVDLKKKNI